MILPARHIVPGPVILIVGPKLLSPVNLASPGRVSSTAPPLTVMFLFPTIAGVRLIESDRMNVQWICQVLRGYWHRPSHEVENDVAGIVGCWWHGRVLPIGRISPVRQQYAWRIDKGGALKRVSSSKPA